MYPFHISMEGMKSVVLCRDDEDYDHLEKSFYLCALKCDCRVIIEIAMSNHGHVAVLAPDMPSAERMGVFIKKRHAQYMRWKYHEPGLLRRTDINIQYLDSDSYVRNALAYIPRNAWNAGIRIEDYRWSGYRGMFVDGKVPCATRAVQTLTRREREAVFHTHEDLSGVPWLINLDGGVEPASACDHEYLESAFAFDQTFFLKTIGALNEEEIRQKLVLNGRVRLSDKEFLPVVHDLARRWFQKTISELTPENKARLLRYLFRSYRTSPSQLSRCLQMSYDAVLILLKINDPEGVGR